MRPPPPPAPTAPLLGLLILLGSGLLLGLLASHTPFSAQTSPQYGAESSSSSSFVEPILPFKDVDWHSLEGSAVYFLLTHGVIRGYPDGTFRGGEVISRAELAKMLVLAGNVPITRTKNNGWFHDVAEGEWYTPFLMTAAAWGIVEGYPTQRILLKPSAPVNTAEFLKMLTRTFHLQEGMFQSYRDVPEGLWYESFAGAAWQYELFPLRPATFLQPKNLLTRREAAIALNLLFHQPQRRRLPPWTPPVVPVLPFTPLPSPPVSSPSSLSSLSFFPTSSSLASETTSITSSQETTGPFGGATGLSSSSGATTSSLPAS